MPIQSAVSTQGLLGSVVPNVYIDCITLETTGSPLERDDPHIKHPLEVSAKTADPQSLIVHLDLILKETLDDTLIANWFEELDFIKYLNITVYQSSDLSSTKYFLDNVSSISNSKFQKKLRTRLEQKKVSVLHDQVLEHRRTIDSGPKNSISVQDKASSLNQHYSYVDQDGNKIHDITYRMTFKSANVYPKHLAYFAFASLDLESLANDFNLNLPNSSAFNVTGRVANEVVIDDFKTVSQSYVYRTQNGEIWSGEAHRTPDKKYKTGRFANANSQPLVRETVVNYKIQDFRDLKNIENLSIQFDDIENNLLPEINSQGILNKYVFDLGRSNATIFTDSFLARDPDGSCRILFGIDFRKVIKNNSLFRAFFQNTDNSSIKNIVGLSRIREAKLVRRRVKKGSSTIEPFDRNAIPEILATSGQSGGGTIRLAENDRASLTEIRLFHRDSQRFRYFTGVDRGMKFVTDGIYQYGIELEVEDGTAEYLKGLLDRLYISRDFLNNYLNLALIPGNFDPSGNKFTQRFTSSVRNTYTEKKPWVTPVQTYVSILRVVYKTSFNYSKLVSKLYNVIQPEFGSPRGIEFFVKLMNNLITQFQTALSTHNVFPNNRPRSEIQSQNVHKKSGIPRSIKIEKYFDETFNSNVLKFTGYDFLSETGVPTSGDGPGLKTVKGSDFIRRTNLEILKYFTSLEEDINIDIPGVPQVLGQSLREASFSHLSPSSVNLQGFDPLVTLLEQGGLNKDVDKYSDLMSEVVRTNSEGTNSSSTRSTRSTSEKSKRLSPEQSRMNNVLTSILSLSNVSFVSLTQRQGESLTPPVPDTLISEEIFGETKTGTDKFPITREQTLCFNSDLYFDLDIGSMLKKIINIKFIKSVQKKSIPGTPSPVKLASYDFKSENNFIAVASSRKVPPTGFGGSKNEQGSTEGRFVPFRETAPVLQYGNQNLSPDCFELGSSGVGEDDDTGLTLPPVSDALTATQPTRISADWNSVPLPAKSLFVGSFNPSAVVENFHNVGEDILQDVGNFFFFWTNYKNLMRIEVLTGYKRSWFGATQTKVPIWKTMTYTIYKNSIGKNLLCRLREENERISGTSSPISSCDSGEGCVSFSREEGDFIQKMSLPVFHKYFILIPEARGVTEAGPLGRRGLALARTVRDALEEEFVSEDISLGDIESPFSNILESLESGVGIRREFISANITRIGNIDRND